MPIFSLTNQLTGYTADVYQRGPNLYEVEISDALGDYIAGHLAQSKGEAISYALQHN